MKTIICDLCGKALNEKEGIRALSLTIFYNYQIVTIEKELNQLKHLGSVYTDTEGNAFIRFNNSDQHQQALLKEIQAYCIRNQISRCMPSYQAILNEGRK